MRMSREAFKALLGTGNANGVAREILTLPGEAATFIAILSMAGVREDPRDAARGLGERSSRY